MEKERNLKPYSGIAHIVGAGTRVLPKVSYLLSLLGFCSLPSLAVLGTKLQSSVEGSNGLGCPYRDSLHFTVMCQNVEREVAEGERYLWQMTVRVHG